MFPAAVIFLSAVLVSKSNACVPTAVVTTTTTTTTAPCCTMLSQSTLPRRSSSITTQEQCSVLQRVSSTCPVDGIVVCDAAQDTNPTAILVELFNSSGTVVRAASVSGSPATTVTVRVICINGVWRVPLATGDSTTATSAAISSVSCSQSGSQGADRGYVIGTSI